jgi:hypothetical protein
LFSSTDPHHEYVIRYTLRSTKEVIEIRRRFSEFEKLYKVLCLTKPGVAVPRLPPKSLLSKAASIDSEVIQQRRTDLDNFLNEVLLNAHLSDVRSFRDFIQRPKPFNPQEYESETTGKFDRAYTLKNEGLLDSSTENQSKLLTAVYSVGEYIKNKVYGTSTEQLQSLFGAFAEQGIRQMCRFKKEEDCLFDLHAAYATMEKAFHEQASVYEESCANQQHIQETLLKTFALNER